MEAVKPECTNCVVIGLKLIYADNPYREMCRITSKENSNSVQSVEQKYVGCQIEGIDLIKCRVDLQDLTLNRDCKIKGKIMKIEFS